MRWVSLAVATAKETQRIEARHEFNRLLYVALTRARDRLYIAGYTGPKGRPAGCWSANDRRTRRAVVGPRLPGPASNWRESSRAQTDSYLIVVPGPHGFAGPPAQRAVVGGVARAQQTPGERANCHCRHEVIHGDAHRSR